MNIYVKDSQISADLSALSATGKAQKGKKFFVDLLMHEMMEKLTHPVPPQFADMKDEEWDQFLAFMPHVFQKWKCWHLFPIIKVNGTGYIDGNIYLLAIGTSRTITNAITYKLDTIRFRQSEIICDSSPAKVASLFPVDGYLVYTYSGDFKWVIILQKCCDHLTAPMVGYRPNLLYKTTNSSLESGFFRSGSLQPDLFVDSPQWFYVNNHELSLHKPQIQNVHTWTHTQTCWNDLE